MLICITWQISQLVGALLQSNRLIFYIFLSFIDTLVLPSLWQLSIMYQWIPFRLQRKSPKFPVVTENDLRYMLQCIKRTTNWTNSRAQISSDGHDRMGRKIQLPPPPKKKIPRVSNKIRKNPWTKKWHNTLYFIRRSTRPGYAGTTTKLQIVLDTRKIPT